MKSKKIINLLRYEIVKMSNRAKASHLASSLSCIDIIATIYFDIMKSPSKVIKILIEIEFILSKGHAATALYAVLAYKGIINKKDLLNYGKKFIIRRTSKSKIKRC